jgi:DNA-binding beta-propeller fold protein YncE
MLRSKVGIRLVSRRRRNRVAGIAFAFALACGGLSVAAPATWAANSLYWANYSANTISFASLGNTGGGNLNTSGATVNGPSGVSFDPTAGRIYWANANGNSISFANLDNSGGGGALNTTGATVSTPEELAVDRANGKVYWANYGNNTIAFANLDNSGGGGTLNTTGTTVSGPIGIAIDPSTNRIYWANFANNTISFANLDDSGGGATLDTTGTTPKSPFGVALDPVNGRIYWANQGGSTNTGIGFANANDTGGGGTLNTTGAAVMLASGVAVDPAANKVYWANQMDGISFANADSSGGGGNLNVTGTTLASTAGTPNGPALLESPSAISPPAIGGGSVAPTMLSCSQGKWASDLIGSLLYRAPQSFSFSWSVNGKPIAGASAASVVASSPGAYTCRVTATNHAGSTALSSAPHNVASPPSPTAQLLAVSRSGATATLTLGCGGAPGQQCSVSAIGTVNERKRGTSIVAVTAAKAPKGGGRPRARTVTVTVTRGSFTVPAGGSLAARVTLNRSGKQLLARFDALPVRLSLSGDVTATRTVVFTSSRLTATTPPDIWFHIDLPCSDCYSSAQNVPITGLSRGVHVAVSCRGSGCPFSRRSVAPQNRRINLATVLGGSHLEPGAVIQVAISARGKIGEVVRYAIQRGAGPVRTILCQAPGANRPQRCA